MRSVIAYAYPWDIIDDPGALERLRDLGADAVAIAVNYHGVRAATPSHPRHRVVDAEHAAMYLDLDEGIWAGCELRPGSAERWAGRDSAARAAAVVAAAGFAVRSWLVLTHNSRLGTQHPDLTVKDAYGTPSRYALCPTPPRCATTPAGS